MAVAAAFFHLRVGLRQCGIGLGAGLGINRGGNGDGGEDEEFPHG